MFRDIYNFIARPLRKIYQVVKDFFFPEPEKPPPAKKKEVLPNPIRRSSSHKIISILLIPPSNEHARSYSEPGKKRLSFNSVTYVCDDKGKITHAPLFGHNVKNEKYRPKKKTLTVKMLEYFNRDKKQKKPKPSRHSC